MCVLINAFETDAKSAFGLVIATGPGEFLGAGTGFCISFSLKAAGPAHVGIGSVDEGTFSDGVWAARPAAKRRRRRSGQMLEIYSQANPH